MIGIPLIKEDLMDILLNQVDVKKNFRKLEGVKENFFSGYFKQHCRISLVHVDCIEKQSLIIHISKEILPFIGRPK
jgi:hypothetical protein